MKQLSFIGSIIAGLFFSGVAIASAHDVLQTLQSYRILQQTSHIEFEATINHVTAKGEFKAFGSTVYFDPNNLKDSTMTVVIQMDSVYAFAPEMVTELKKPEWFNTIGYPEAVFRSTSFRSDEKNKYQVSGDLTIKGVTERVTIPITITEQDNGINLVTGSFVINRKNYHVGEGAWASSSTVAEPVKITFAVEAVKG